MWCEMQSCCPCLPFHCFLLNQRFWSVVTALCFLKFDRSDTCDIQKMSFVVSAVFKNFGVVLRPYICLLV